MIEIRIDKPLKLSGLESIQVIFDYNEKIIETIKSQPMYYYHKKNHIWELPIYELSSLLDALTLIDDIKLYISPNLSNFSLGHINTSNAERQAPEAPKSLNYKAITEDEINKLGFKPYKHQIEGINYGLEKNKFLLLDNPGCGKTNQIIGLAEVLKQRGLIDHCLIIAGINSLKSNWRKEINKFSKESCIIIGEKKKKDGTVSKTPMSIIERVEQLSRPINEFFVIINVESLRDDKVIKAISSGPNKYGLIAIDEVHKCLATGKSSTQGSNILKLDAPYKVAATGTLLLNNPINCWGPLSWTSNDKSTLTNFKAQYCKFGGFNNSQVIGYKNLDLLKEELESCSIRRSKEDLVDLPPKTITMELLDMNPDHMKFYDAIVNGVKEEADKIELNSNNLLALTTRLRQATACPEVLTSNNIMSTKVERAVELAEEIVDSKHKVVIMSTFKQPVYKLAELLKDYKPLICTGDQSDIEVSNNVDLFQNDDEHYILIGTLSKMSTGLTLNRASDLIMLDEHWTAAMNAQCQDRIYRLNNTTPAFITILACKDTIDERVHDVAQYKQELSDFVVDDKPSERFTDTLRSIITEL